MDKRFLLTYLSDEGRFEYSWFETEEELKDFRKGRELTTSRVKRIQKTL